MRFILNLFHSIPGVIKYPIYILFILVFLVFIFLNFSPVFGAHPDKGSIDLKAKVLFPIHWSKFDLSIHPWDEPIIHITKEAPKRNVNITTPMIGEVFDLANLPNNPWWEALRN